MHAGQSGVWELERDLRIYRHKDSSFRNWGFEHKIFRSIFESHLQLSFRLIRKKKRNKKYQEEEEEEEEKVAKSSTKKYMYVRTAYVYGYKIVSLPSQKCHKVVQRVEHFLRAVELKKIDIEVAYTLV